MTAYTDLSTDGFGFPKAWQALQKLDGDQEAGCALHFGRIVGRSPALRRALRQVESVGPTDSTVLLHGDTGTGKELLAQAVHELSPRRTGPLVKLNCAAIPSGLVISDRGMITLRRRRYVSGGAAP